MSNTHRRRSASSSARPGASRTTSNALIVVASLVALILVAAVVVAVLGSRDDDSEGAPGDSLALAELGIASCPPPDPSAPPDVGAAAPAAPGPATPSAPYQPVVVAGAPLAPFTAEIQAGNVPDPALCARAPIVSGYDYTGNPITIDATTSGPTLVVVLAHWCPHCAREIPVLNAWHDSGDVPAGLQVVGLSTAIDANAQNYPPDQWLAAVNWRWRVLADDQQRAALTAFGGTSFPTMIFVGPDGLVRWRISGEYPVEEIQERVDAAMASSVPATTSTSTAAATETAPPSVAAATTATTATTAATTAIVATQPETNALATG